MDPYVKYKIMIENHIEQDNEKVLNLFLEIIENDNELSDGAYYSLRTQALKKFYLG